jgi:galacturonosyltransferase
MAEQNIVEFLGPSTDTRIEMSDADCIVMPSWHEGMSNVLLEGAAMGLPLIASDISGCREAVEDGVTGFLCRPGNTESLIAAMDAFLALPEAARRAMGLSGREKMIREFDRSRVVECYLDGIRAALEAGDRKRGGPDG